MGNQCGKSSTAATARKETEVYELQLRVAQANVFVAQAKARDAEILSNQKFIAAALQSKCSELKRLKEEFARFGDAFRATKTMFEAYHARHVEMEAQLAHDARSLPEPSIDQEIAAFKLALCEQYEAEIERHSAASAGIEIAESVVSEACAQACAREQSLSDADSQPECRVSSSPPLTPKPVRKLTCPIFSPKPKPDAPASFDTASGLALVRRNTALSKIDNQSSQVQRKMSRIQVNLEEVYGDSTINSPRSHPKVKNLNRALAKLRKRLRVINKMRYNMRRDSRRPQTVAQQT